MLAVWTHISRVTLELALYVSHMSFSLCFFNKCVVSNALLTLRAYRVLRLTLNRVLNDIWLYYWRYPCRWLYSLLTHHHYTIKNHKWLTICSSNYKTIAFRAHHLFFYRFILDNLCLNLFDFFSKFYKINQQVIFRYSPFLILESDYFVSTTEKKLQIFLKM